MKDDGTPSGLRVTDELLLQLSDKPMFFLTPADGALGGHGAAVQACYQDFRTLAISIANRCGLALP